MIMEAFRRARLVARGLSGQVMDGLDELEMDHMRVRATFLQIRATRDRARREKLFLRVARDLETHLRIEEEVFYPACEKVKDLREMALEAREEHRQVKTLLKEIASLAKDSERWEPKVFLVMENVEHHVREEERKLFPKVRRRFDSTELEALGRDLRAARRERKAAA